ncbi:hypothetical protein IU450_31150 [Nocardia abscessus]|uniref:hypothetical protein n=1 Tax=Nocardia abscessus TaxID=120957 RepID=UPI001893B941|nr:hypothetical protein [Nocardia abscessus]MBF6340317.1 hypothetical protein [Nocardia abscessus]
MDDEQIGFDIEFDDKTQAFLDWVAPERMESGVRAFLSATVPDMADDAAWWKPPLSTRTMEAAKQLFGEPGLTATENRELADGFIRFLGECYVRRGGLQWTNRPGWGQPLYTDFGPAVQGDDTRSMVAIAQDLADSDGPRLIEYNISEAVRQTRKSRNIT